MNDELDWFDDMVAASKEAAGLPADWGATPMPLSAEAELEDAPQPPRLRSGMTTAELLPYGDVVRSIYGDEFLLERLSCPAVRAPRGEIVACDPVSLEWQGAPLKFDLGSEELPVEIGVFRMETPRGVLVRSAVAVIGDVAAVTNWSALSDPDSRLSVDKGCMTFAAAGALDEVAVQAGVRVSEVNAKVVVPVEQEGVVVGVLIAPGDGPWGYEVLTGVAADGRTVALLVDHHLMERG